MTDSSRRHRGRFLVMKVKIGVGQECKKKRVQTQLERIRPGNLKVIFFNTIEKTEKSYVKFEKAFLDWAQLHSKRF